MTSAIPAMGQNYPHLPLRISEPEDRHGPHSSIMVFDADHNDIAEFFHLDHATVSQTYEQALSLASAFVAAVNSTQAEV